MPDDIEGIIVEYNITNNTDISKQVKLSLNVFIDLSPVWLSEKLNLLEGKDDISFYQSNKTLTIKNENNE
ncbi:MAG: hypothetical protein ACI9A7_000654 [Cyclobacteriaceae bacterium]